MFNGSFSLKKVLYIASFNCVCEFFKSVSFFAGKVLL